MPINLGSTSIGSLYLGSTEIGSAYLGNVKIYENVPPLNPLNLPAKTLRIKFADGFTPSVTSGKGSAVQVSASPNVWDITYDYDGTNSWYCLSYNIGSSSDRVKIQEILGANGTGITNMSQIFYNCSNLTSVSLFDTSSATTMSSMFRSSSLTSAPLFNTSSATDLGSMFSGCSSLTSVPLFNTSSATDMSYMFNGCYNVASGALALYQQASTQAVPPSSHSSCFRYCGRDTVTGAAELAQISEDWGGTLSSGSDEPPPWGGGSYDPGFE